MRKLLILLSVVLAVALCQSIKRPLGRVPPYHPINRLDCTFGIKKVNGTRKCKNIEEFFQHPRNDTNCSKLRRLKCYKFKNATACLCVRKPKLFPHPDFPQLCKPGFVWRCKKDNIDCKCTRFGPVRVNDTLRLKNKCPEGEEFFCSVKTGCKCRKIDRTPVIKPVVEPVDF